MDLDHRVSLLPSHDMQSVNHADFMRSCFEDALTALGTFKLNDIQDFEVQSSLLSEGYHKRVQDTRRLVGRGPYLIKSKLLSPKIPGHVRFWSDPSISTHTATWR